MPGAPPDGSGSGSSAAVAEPVIASPKSSSWSVGRPGTSGRPGAPGVTAAVAALAGLLRLAVRGEADLRDDLLRVGRRSA